MKQSEEHYKRWSDRFVLGFVLCFFMGLVAKLWFDSIGLTLLCVVAAVGCWLAGLCMGIKENRRFMAARMAEGMTKKEAHAAWHKKYPDGGGD